MSHRFPEGVSDDNFIPDVVFGNTAYNMPGQDLQEHIDHFLPITFVKLHNYLQYTEKNLCIVHTTESRVTWLSSSTWYIHFLDRVIARRIHNFNCKTVISH